MSAPLAAFYFDLASPLAYLAAERVLHVLPGPAEWQPVLARELPGAESFEAFRCREEEETLRTELARRARELGLQPLRWPNPFPFDSELAMRVATYAKSIGRAVPFAQAAFRQAFAGGHSLQEPDRVLIAAAACEMHPAAVLRGAHLRAVDLQLSQSTANAAQAGILDVPAVAVGDAEPDPVTGAAGPGWASLASAPRVFLGERAVEEAAAYMGARISASRTSAGPR
jgi:2-hydroxychromene-2-carboxylate isomerase